VTDGLTNVQTDTSTIAKTREALHAVAHQQMKPVCLTLLKKFATGFESVADNWKTDFRVPESFRPILNLNKVDKKHFITKSFD